MIFINLYLQTANFYWFFVDFAETSKVTKCIFVQIVKYIGAVRKLKVPTNVVFQGRHEN